MHPSRKAYDNGADVYYRYFVGFGKREHYFDARCLFSQAQYTTLGRFDEFACTKYEYANSVAKRSAQRKGLAIRPVSLVGTHDAKRRSL